MSKVKITQEQADAIKEIKGNDLYTALKTREVFIKSWGNNPLSHLTLYDLSDVLINGYEIKPEFKEGDWVHSERNGVTARITNISRAKLYIDSKEHDSVPIPDARHATTEEIAKEEERRVNEKLESLLYGLTEYELGKLQNKIDDKLVRF